MILPHAEIKQDVQLFASKLANSQLELGKKISSQFDKCHVENKSAFLIQSSKY